MQHEKEENTQLLKKMGKGVAWTSHGALAVVFLSPPQGLSVLSPQEG